MPLVWQTKLKQIDKSRTFDTMFVLLAYHFPLGFLVGVKWDVAAY